jgi:diguanylate cyclase (GGDEF)-like protein
MVGRTLETCSRYADIVGRWGGEEFLAIISNVEVGRLAEVAERFRMLVEHSGFELDVPIGVTVSIGSAEIRAEDDADSLVSRADRNLYLAKQTGRNRVCS